MNGEPYDLWYERLRLVNFGSIKKIGNVNMISRDKLDSTSKCEICVQVNRVGNLLPLYIELLNLYN